jgi:dihydroorotase
MEFTKLTEIELPAAFDAHVHLRDGEMSQLVTPTIRKGGVNQVYVMVRASSVLLQHIYMHFEHLSSTLIFCFDQRQVFSFSCFRNGSFQG